MLGALGHPVWGWGFRSSGCLTADLCFFESICKVSTNVGKLLRTQQNPGPGALGRQSGSGGRLVGGLVLNNYELLQLISFHALTEEISLISSLHE